MAIQVIDKDLFEVTPDMILSDVHCSVTSPPYKPGDGFSLELMKKLGQIYRKVMPPGSRVFMNFGQLRGGFDRPFKAAEVLCKEGGLKFGQVIIWVKSIAMGGWSETCQRCEFENEVEVLSRGHFQPITSKKLLNYCWEYVFQLYKAPESELDRLSVGVPYTDKGNLKRDTRGKNGDLHCAGDVWFIPYETTGKTKKKKHEYEFPAELVRRCLLLAGLEKGSTVFDPFGGSGTVAAVAKTLGHSSVLVERDQTRAQGAIHRWRETPEYREEPGKGLTLIRDGVWLVS